MTSVDIKKILSQHAYNDIFIPEFTYGDLRIDAILLDTRHRWIRGYEIKVDRSDFLKDGKWTQYTQFCSSICIVCPEGLIQPEEIEKPFGLIWVFEKPGINRWSYKKKPINFQQRRSMAWLYVYLKVIELEFRRLNYRMDTKIQSC